MEKINSLTKQAIYCLIIFKFLYAVVKAEGGCPPDDDIWPCICHNSPYPVLQCTSIQNEDILKEVFAHSKGYKYREVRVQLILSNLNNSTAGSDIKKKIKKKKRSRF